MRGWRAQNQPFCGVLPPQIQGQKLSPLKWPTLSVLSSKHQKMEELREGRRGCLLYIADLTEADIVPETPRLIKINRSG